MKLETKRLILRKPRIRDIETIYKLVDFEIIKNFMMPYPYKLEHTIKWISSSLKWWGSQNYMFVLKLKEINKIIGMVGVLEVNRMNNSAKVFSWIGKKYWRRGYATEAKIAINDFAFNKLKLRKLKSSVIKTNKKSNKMQTKFGFTKEGTMIKETFNPVMKKFVDMNIYSIFKPEWKKARPKLIKEMKKKLK